jgi:oxygen-independent coproporphyrinogen-3 oxidase
MISAYIHVPFCVDKCLYCGFYSTQFDSPLADLYLAALELEMKSRAGVLQDHRFTSLYIGGGTPTTLSLAQISRLFDLVDKHIIRTDDAEVTIEANPNTATAGTLSLLKSRGVNRLSIGVQSFSDIVLSSLGRAHSADDALTAFRTARTAGFSNIGIDLIYGVPGQTEQHWQHTLESTLSLGPEHISVYSLSLDEGSRLSREVEAGKIILPDEDVVARMYHTAVTCLANAGYRQYEISNFSIQGRGCQHNSNYWARGEYLGFGPGASSFIGNRRYTTIANVSEFISRMMNGVDAVGTMEVLQRDQEASEMLFLGLRRVSGVDLEHFGRVFGTDAKDELIKRVRMLDETGLFKIDGSRLSLTMHGFLLSNSALAAILP